MGATNSDASKAEEPGAPEQAGPVLIAYDGSPAAERGITDAAHLLVERRALVLVVWRSGLGFESLGIPATPGLPPTLIDIPTALEIDESQHEGAERLARKGARMARDAGFDAEALVVADAREASVSGTIVRVARERRACAVVVGEHTHGRLEEVFLGDTARDLIRHAPCPVIVVRDPEAPPSATD